MRLLFPLTFQLLLLLTVLWSTSYCYQITTFPPRSFNFFWWLFVRKHSNRINKSTNHVWHHSTRVLFVPRPRNLETQSKTSWRKAKRSEKNYLQLPKQCLKFPGLNKNCFVYLDLSPCRFLSITTVDNLPRRFWSLKLLKNREKQCCWLRRT